MNAVHHPAGIFPRKPRRWRTLLVIGLSVACIAIAGAYMAGVFSQAPDGVNASPGDKGTGVSGPASQNTPASQARALEVQVLKPQRRDIAYSVRLPATLSPLAQATLYAKVSGYLKAIHVDKGDSVKAGQVLAVLDDPELEQRYQQAQSEHAIKKVTYERLANVWKENPDVIAKQDVDVAEAAYLGATHALEQLATMVDYTNVRAPFTGVITARFVDVGALIQAATSSATQTLPLFTLMDMSTIRVYVSVPQEDAPLVKPGIPASVRVAQFPEKNLTGTVTRTTGVLDPATRTMLVEIHIPNKDRLLQPGMFGEAVIRLKSHRDALAIPPAALITESSGASVFVVAQGKAQKVSVKTDLDDGVWIEITEGLAGHEDVVVVGKARLRDGAPAQASPYNIPSGKPASQHF
jgi:RND family efflux transporter MFP subunit